MVNVHSPVRTAQHSLFALQQRGRLTAPKAHTNTPADTFETILDKQTATPETPAAQAKPTTMGTITAGMTPPVVNPTTVSPQMAPAAEALFGANPWITTAGGTGPNGASYSYNKYYFATPETAAKVAQMLGGKVVATNDLTPYGPFVQSHPNYMVQMPDGRQINAGIIASYYDHGWSQQRVDSLVNCEIAGSSVPTT